MMEGQNFQVHAEVERQGVVLHAVQAVQSVAVQTEADLEPHVMVLLQQFEDGCRAVWVAPNQKP